MTDHIVPAGIYFFCDPCYAIPDDQWDRALDLTDFYNRMAAMGKHKAVTMGFNTAYGDGSYEASNGFSYPVDAGLIGLTDIRLNPDLYAKFEAGDEHTRQMMTLLVLTEPTRCFLEGSVMHFGDVTIDTDPPAEDEPEADEDDETFDDEQVEASQIED